VFISDVGLAALRNADDLWAGMMLLLALAAVLSAVLGAVILRGHERAWWSGFAYFAGTYLALALGPWLSDNFQPRLGTTHLLGRIHGWMHPAMYQMEASLTYLQAEREGTLAKWISLQQSDGKNHPATLYQKTELAALDQKIAGIKGAPTQDHFQRVGHALFTLLTGLVGGMIGGWFYAKRERDRAAAGWKPAN
jgi:hypothetical protein